MFIVSLVFKMTIVCCCCWKKNYRFFYRLIFYWKWSDVITNQKQTFDLKFFLLCEMNPLLFFPPLYWAIIILFYWQGHLKISFVKKYFTNLIGSVSCGFNLVRLKPIIKFSFICKRNTKISLFSFNQIDLNSLVDLDLWNRLEVLLLCR